MSHLILYRSWETDEPGTWNSATSNIWDDLWQPHLNWGKKKIDSGQLKQFDLVGYTIEPMDDLVLLTWKNNITLKTQARRQINV